MMTSSIIEKLRGLRTNKERIDLVEKELEKLSQSGSFNDKYQKKNVKCLLFLLKQENGFTDILELEYLSNTKEDVTSKEVYQHLVTEVESLTLEYHSNR